VKKINIKIDDLYKIKYLREITLSPDGKKIVYTVEWMDKKDNKYYRNLYVVDRSGKSRIFIRGKKSVANPKWSPDGKLISFMMTEKEKTNLWAIPADGGEAHQITDTEGSLGNYLWTPGGRWIVCEFTEKKIDKERQPDKDKPPLYYRITKPFYKLDNLGMLPEEKPHIWKINARSGEMKQLTFGPNGDGDPAVSSDGHKIVYISNRQKDYYDKLLYLDIFICDLEGKNEIRLNAPAGPKGRPVFAPDGRSVAYIGSLNPEDFSVRYDHVWQIPVKGGRAKNLTAGRDLCLGDYVIDDLGHHGSDHLIYDRDGTHVYFPVTEKGTAVIYRFEIATRKVAKVAGDKERIYAYDYDGRKTFALAIGNQSDPGNLYLLSGGERTRLTDLNKDYLSRRRVGVPEEIWFKGNNNLSIQGWLLNPPEIQKNKKYPMAVQIHGGPHTAYGYSFFHEFQVLAGSGIAVFYCNPHGSMGNRENFAKALNLRWGIPDSVDILKAIKLLTGTRPYLDKKGLAVMGGSYGGFMTNWLIGHTNIFKAAVTMRSVVNMLSFISTDFGYTLGREFKGPWWEKDNFRFYWDMSPLKYARNMRTPLLILHSEQDHRCPISQAEELFITLKTLKRDVEMVRFPGESHELSRHGTPRRREKRLYFIVDFLKRHLPGVGTPKKK
jgi:dipeptidyl aminopeptidase/acylaminoacyl peptidase